MLVARHSILVLAAAVGAANLVCGAVPTWEPILAKDRAAFIMALAEDKAGNVWIGTEDKGVFRYNPSADELLQWSQFTTKDGLGDDNAYAIACDKVGRVWVGTLNHGVSVYNGDKWKNYDVLDGPIGERIFAIATCPTDGDVWMATSAGLTRYSLKDDTWTHYTREDSLPGDLATSLAFDQKGNLFVGLECDGIAIGRAADEYRTWTHVSGPSVPMLQTAGLAKSKDQGKTWNYVRGRDFAGKAKGRFRGAPPGWQEPPPAVLNRLLPEEISWSETSCFLTCWRLLERIWT